MRALCGWLIYLPAPRRVPIHCLSARPRPISSQYQGSAPAATATVVAGRDTTDIRTTHRTGLDATV
jgi:hypothetical protein